MNRKKHILNISEILIKDSSYLKINLYFKNTFLTSKVWNIDSVQLPELANNFKSSISLNDKRSRN